MYISILLKRSVFGCVFYNIVSARVISKCTPEFQNKSVVDGWMSSESPICVYFEVGV